MRRGGVLSSLDHDRIGCHAGRQPAASERLKQAQYRLKPVETIDVENVLVREPGLLGLQQGDEIDGSLAQSRFGELERPLRGRHREALQALRLSGIGNCDEGNLNVVEA